MNPRLSISIFLLASVCTTYVKAGIVGTMPLLTTHVDVQTGSEGGPLTDDDDDQSNIGPITSSASISGTGTASGFAWANYGILGAQATGTGNDDIADSAACFDDVLSIIGGPSSGPGSIDFLFTVTGAIDQTTPSTTGGSASARLRAGSSGGTFSDTTFTVANPTVGGQATINQQVTASLSISFGTTIDLAVALEAETDKIADVDFSTTAILSGIVVSNSLGQPISATVVGQSGTTYPIPEPSGLLLASAAVFCVMSQLRVRH